MESEDVNKNKKKRDSKTQKKIGPAIARVSRSISIDLARRIDGVFHCVSSLLDAMNLSIKRAERWTSSERVRGGEWTLWRNLGRGSGRGRLLDWFGVDACLR